MAGAETWHNCIGFGFHYDLHANEHDTELGADVSHAMLRAE